MVLKTPTLDIGRLFLLSEKHKSFVEIGRGQLYETPLWAQIIMWVIPIAGIFWALHIGATALNERALYEEFLQSGVASQAQVISHRVDEGEHTHYYVTYQFNGIANNQISKVYTKEEVVTKISYDKIKDGSFVTIYYLPRDPQTSYFEPLTELPLWLSLTPIIYLLLNFYLLYALSKGRRKKRRLENEGRILSGEIVECKGKKVNKEFQVTIKYRFQTPLGEEKSGRTTHTRNDLKDTVLPSSSTPVAVLYADEKTFAML
jgi:hypothetical protein